MIRKSGQNSVSLHFGTQESDKHIFNGELTLDMSKDEKYGDTWIWRRRFNDMGNKEQVNVNFTNSQRFKYDSNV